MLRACGGLGRSGGEVAERGLYEGAAEEDGEGHAGR